MRSVSLNSLILAVSSLALPVHGVELASKNLGFEEWQTDQTKPAGWKLVGTAHKLSADCQIAKEGKCSARLENLTQTPAALTALVQTLPASSIGGHPLILSGWIKTLDVQGQAEFFLQVDARTKSAVAETSLGKLAPAGTQDWQRFSIKVPVAANAAFVHFGLGFKGSGTAWFDDLALEVDESTAVADLSEVRRPARPQKITRLLDEQEMTLAASLIPPVKPEWQTGIRQNTHGLHSMFSEDFSDLQFLKPLLKDKRIVQLGESGHGIAEFNWMKVRLIKFLHQEMGFDVIAMEASMSTADAVNKDVARLTPAEAMRDSQFATIGTAETLDLFDYLKQSQSREGGLILAGFDNQNSGWQSTAAISARFKSMLSLLDTEQAAQVDALEQDLNNLISKRKMQLPAEELEKRYDRLASTLESGRAKLLANNAGKDSEIAMTIQEARARIRLCQQLTTADPAKAGMEIRDQMMAENLNFLLDSVYPKKKVIVWAHNTHVANAWVTAGSPKTMGVWMAERRRKEMYTIGLYMSRGVLGFYGHDTFSEIAAPAPDSMEAILANGGKKMSMVDFSQAKHQAENNWMFAPIKARYWGSNDETIIPAQAYDAIIYIDSVTPSEYMK